MSILTPEVFLAIVDRMNRNIAPVMTVLMPAALLSIIPVLFLSYQKQLLTFYLTAMAFGSFIVALLVTGTDRGSHRRRDRDMDGIHATVQLAAGSRSLDKVSCYSGDRRPRKPRTSSSCRNFP